MNDLDEKKCGIITFHRAHNYGAVLQAYALQRAVSKLGYYVGIIDYSPDTINTGYALVPKKSKVTWGRYIKAWVGFFLDIKRKTRRFKKFNDFINRKLNLLCVNDKCVDVLLLGSDQIWNPHLTGAVDPVYFGFIEPMKPKRIISYAASMGTTELDGAQRDSFFSYLNNLDYIGVREDSLKEYIGSHVAKNVTITLDPTLLLDKCDWDDIAEFNSKTADEYCLVYEVQPHPATEKIVSTIRNELNIQVIKIGAKSNHRISRDVITDSSPGEFVGYFKRAKFVITTSFHGTVFSIINNIPFITLQFNNSIDLRSKSLLTSLGLQDHLIADPDLKYILHMITEFNPNSYREKLDNLRTESLTYLTDSICHKP